MTTNLAQQLRVKCESKSIPWGAKWIPWYPKLSPPMRRSTQSIGQSSYAGSLSVLYVLHTEIPESIFRKDVCYLPVLLIPRIAEQKVLLMYIDEVDSPV
jgi:hypothetical protein